MAGLSFRNLRYGDGGILGAAAAGAGAADAYQTQKAQDMSLINSEADRRARLAESTQQNELESQKLQMAGQLALQRGATATNANTMAETPLSRAILNAKQLAIQNAGSDLSPNEQAMFSADAMAPGTVNEFNQMIQRTVARKQGTAAKNQLLNAAKGQIDESDLPTISAMLGDPEFTTAHVAEAIQKSAANRQQKTNLAADQTAKNDLWTKAQGLLTPESLAQIAPFAQDPKVSGQQFHQMASQLYQREQADKAAKQKAQTLTLGQQLTENRHQIDLLERNKKALEADKSIDWNESDPQKATGGDPNLMERFKLHQELDAQIKTLMEKGKEVVARSGATLLHSPSTQRTFMKLPNGTVVEVPPQEDDRGQ